jgi:hypothetical protein
MPLLVGTGSATELGFSWSATQEHIVASALNLLGVNWGPAYLVGEPFDGHPPWLQVLTIIQVCVLVALGLVVTSSFASERMKTRCRDQSPSFAGLFLSPIMFCLLLVSLVLPVVVTIRLEQRWLLIPFIVLLIYVSQLSKVIDRFAFPIRASAWAGLIVLLAVGLAVNFAHLPRMGAVFFIGAQKAALINLDVAKSAIENEELAVSEDCGTPTTGSYLSDLLFANFPGHSIKIVCVGLTPPPEVDYVKFSDDGLLHKYP